MARLTEIAIQDGSLRYELTIEFDDGALVEDRLDFTVQALAFEDEEELGSVSIGVAFDFPRQVVVFTLPTGERREIPFGALSFMIDEEGHEQLDASDASMDNVHAEVSEAIGPALVDVLGEIPVGDPLVCLLKGGVSSTVGQALACKEMVGENARAIVGCLREHVGGIFRRTLWRTAKCILFL